MVFAKSELKEYLMDNNVDFIEFTNMGDVNRWIAGLLAGDIDLPERKNEIENPCPEIAQFEKDNEKQKKEDAPEKLKMEKIVRDMGDGRYIVYYDWA